MRAVILLAKPGSSFHFGDYTPFGETFLDHTSAFPHSDTIFSALVNIHNQVWPDETEKFVMLFREGKIRISSGMFCFRGKNKTVFFLPRPMMMKLENQEDRKRLKQVEWISTGIWEKGMVDQEVKTPGKRFACFTEEWNNLTSISPEIFTAYEMNSLPRVKIHSTTREDTLYQQTNITLCGSSDVSISYYFLADCNDVDPEAKNKLETVISLLADTGLGGQRTSGCGFFEDIEWSVNPLPKITDDVFYVNLGLLLPGEDLRNCLAYRVMTRGGRKTEEGQLKKILMIREGALSTKTPRGNIADLSAGGKGKFLRYGMPVCWPVNKKVINM